MSSTLNTATASLRPHPSQHSPTSSGSSHTSTPTSPHFNHQNHQPYSHPYASSSNSVEPRLQSSTASLATTSSVQHPPRPPTPPFLHPPPGQPFSAYLKTWTSSDIAAFLAQYKCSHYAGAFQKNDIDGRVILELDMASLKEMGVSKVGERVKLLGGIKDLRKRATAGPVARVELRLNGSATPPLDDFHTNSPSFSSPSSVLESRMAAHGRLARSTSNGASRRLHTTRPPPLDLQQHHATLRNLPQAYQGSNLPSATAQSRSITPRPILPPIREPGRPPLVSQSSSNVTVTPGSGLVPAPTSSLSRPSNSTLRAPPSRDPGRRSPSPVDFAIRPLPPAPSQAASYASSITLQRNESSTTPTWASLDNQYGLPKGPAPSSLERRPTPQPSSSHRKQPSVVAGTPPKHVSPVKAKFSAFISARPPTSNHNPVHPFAASSRSTDPRKESPPHLAPPNTAETVTSASSSGSASAKRLPPSGYVVGSGSMARESSTSSGNKTRKPTGDITPAHIPLDDLRRQVVKFINSEDGTTRTVNVATCSSGVEVMERVLRKFGKWGTGSHVSAGTDAESDEEGDRLEVDGWGVYAESEPDDNDKPLSEAKLLGICHAHRDGTSMRDHGLVLRRTKKLSNRKNMETFLGENPPPPMSPASPVTYYGGPRLGISGQNEMLTPSKSAGSKKMKRASTVSVMSGLGVPLQDPPSSPGTARSPSASYLAAKGKKVYSFFGHRPPSEIITNHVYDYFPGKKKEVRKSIARMSVSGPGMGRRGSVAMESMRNSLDVPPLPDKRVSMGSDARISPPRRTRPMSTRTISSPPAQVILEEQELSVDPTPPRVSVSNDGGEIVRPSIDGESEDDSIESLPPLLPPFEPSHESLSDSLQAYSPQSNLKPRPVSRRDSATSTRSRYSMLSQLRKNRDRSDTASLLTVDEITAQVENRRASTITFEESDEDVEAVVPQISDPGMVPQSEDEEEDEESEESEEEDSEDEETEDEDEEADADAPEDEHGKAFTSTGAKRSIKWIKGALIGAGSFGSVYLGMDAHSGLLMAVKQVELGTNQRNEERKKSMVVALEREIELLKELQHENIVQYLDSSTDTNHLNIFLEYVPGGSVAALLNNYGAFEEALVRNFVRQILTGLNYLHEREIIHRDIKGANILVDNKGGIKISDFGISKKVESNLMTGMRANRPSLQGSVFWMAPEIVKQTSYTSKADIWSVGCLVVEMLTGTHPWADLTQMQAIFRIGSQAKPVTPSDISTEAADLLKRTFEIDHHARPTAVQLLDHPFIAIKSGGMISAAQARASMAAAQKGLSAPMPSMSAMAR
ncbi:mitogen-activated protein kinase kinase kinase, partial [Tremellales sp. Uapishka_1]